MSQRHQITRAFRISIIYLVVSVFYIVFSDRALLYFFDTIEQINHYQTIKGLSYIFVSGLLIYLLIHRELKKQSEITRSLLNQEEQFQGFINHSSVGIAISDLNGELKEVNDKFCKILRAKREDLLGRHVAEFTYLDDYEKEELEINRLVNREIDTYRLEKRFIIKDKKHIWCDVSFYTNFDDKGSLVSLTAMIIDISEARKARLLMAESESLYRKLFESAPFAIVIMDGYRFANPNSKALELFGYSYEDFVQKTPYDLSPEMQPDGRKSEEKAKELIDAALTNENQLFDWVHQNKKGELLETQIGLTRVTVAHKERVMVFLNDLTDLHKYQKNLLEAKEKAEESDRLKTLFLNNMSHEIRTPMNGIIGFSNFLKEDDLDAEKRDNYVNVIQNSCNHLVRTIDDIIEISDLENQINLIKKEQFNLNVLLTELFSVFNIQAKEKRISLFIRKAFKDSEAFVESDKEKLTRILTKLLSNALKYTKDGSVELAYKLENNQLVFHCKDTGIGISPESQKIIFKPFVQDQSARANRKGGLGIGLSIAQKTAHLLGGEITVESELDKGTVFRLYLPYKQVIQKEENDSKLKNTAQSKRIFQVLIAEDEEINYLFLETLLLKNEQYNFEIAHAKNGLEAYEKGIKMENLDVVLMDIKMPEMSGLEATKSLKEARPKLPIIAQTAYSTEADRRDALDAGCDAFISKPLDAERLFSVLDNYLS